MKNAAYYLNIAIGIAACAWLSHDAQAISPVYLYELYLHNEFYAEPAGLPNKVNFAPMVSSINELYPRGFGKRFFSGAVASLRLTHNSMWIELFAAAGKEQLHSRHNQVHGQRSRTGFDDFLIDCGYNTAFDQENKAQLIIHTLVGIPTFKYIALGEIEQPLLGTRSFRVGGSLEFAYHFVRTKEQEAVFGFIARVLHQFPRKYSLVPSKGRYCDGNTTDLLGLVQYRYFGHHVEAGYDATIITNRAYRFPSYTKRIPSVFLPSVYGLYSYYAEQLSIGFETVLIWGFSSKIKEITWFGVVSYYF